MMAAFKKGAVLAGSSAGAMVMCKHYYKPRSSRIGKGLGLIEGICVLPHHDTFGRQWAKPLGESHPELVLLGIDEQTGIFWEEPGDRAKVLGRGSVAVYHHGTIEYRRSGQEFSLSLLGRSG
jgi:cyanophycinase